MQPSGAEHRFVSNAHDPTRGVSARRLWRAGAFWKSVADLLPPDWNTALVDLSGFGAQSMGGLVAMRIAMEQPRAVRSLVLVATSGGVDLSRFDLDDWRSEYRAEFPNAPAFVNDPTHEDLSDRLGVVRAPTLLLLLLWAQGDRISPPGVGCDDHVFARDHADAVAPLIAQHLSVNAADHT